MAFSSFVKTLNFAIRQQTDTKQTCLKCLLSRRFQTEFVFCLDGALRKSTKCLQNFSPVQHLEHVNQQYSTKYRGIEIELKYF